MRSRRRIWPKWRRGELSNDQATPRGSRTRRRTGEADDRARSCPPGQTESLIKITLHEGRQYIVRRTMERRRPSAAPVGSASGQSGRKPESGRVARSSPGGVGRATDPTSEPTRRAARGSKESVDRRIYGLETGVRRRLHPQGGRPTYSGRGCPLPVPEGGHLGAKQQRLCATAYGSTSTWGRTRIRDGRV